MDQSISARIPLGRLVSSCVRRAARLQTKTWRIAINKCMKLATPLRIITPNCRKALSFYQSGSKKRFTVSLSRWVQFVFKKAKRMIPCQGKHRTAQPPDDFDDMNSMHRTLKISNLIRPSNAISTSRMIKGPGNPLSRWPLMYHWWVENNFIRN